MLNLDDAKADKENVYFFASATPLDGPAQIILRARKKDGEAGNSTVKLRTTDGAAPTGELAGKLGSEEDWTDAVRGTISPSLDQDPLAEGLFQFFVDGKVTVAVLFDEKKKALVEEQSHAFPWAGLKIFGPAKALVWKENVQLPGLAGTITVESWVLEKHGTRREVLELSVKVKAHTPEEIKAQVKTFFDAVNEQALPQWNKGSPGPEAFVVGSEEDHRNAWSSP
ncbi:MAG: hypothetical protein JWO94_2187 [Verrucomicrobiaceae bacterium]|nr:hypothetical protein [Verrucomicrobiaceae bacterium]